MSLTQSKKPKSYLRKRQGAHHRQNKRYVKTYWPYLPMLVIVFLGIGINSFLSHRSSVLGSESNFSVASLLQSTNSFRSADNVQTLVENTSLDSAAQNKAQDMVAGNYWAHVSPTGKSPLSFIASSGYLYQLTGENLAYGFSDYKQVLNAWMNSPEHRANMLNSSYSNIGFGIAQSPNYQGKGPKVIVVAEFGQPVGAAASGQPVNSNLSASTVVPVSRIQALSGASVWLVAAITLISFAAVVAIFIRHGLAFKRLAYESEAFISHHPLLDIVLVMICTTGVILTRTVGIIS